MSYTSSLNYLSDLATIARQSNHRFIVRLVGAPDWQTQLVSRFIEQQGYQGAVKLGGEALTGVRHLPFNQGQLLLGGECDCLVYDAIDGFDANSFSACSGSLLGGGLCFVNFSVQKTRFDGWVATALERVITIDMLAALPNLPTPLDGHTALELLSDQQRAIELVHGVVKGHRKRPLVLTADRGRGKSAGLGIVAAQLMSQRSINIIVTAPTRRSVDVLFYHARAALSLDVNAKESMINIDKSSLSFCAPDQLSQHHLAADLLLVDEASAIPVPLLIKLVLNYHRIVFSSTIHGYEGCGRGFTLKFFAWLDEHRPGWKQFHLSQPVRWSTNDPLEAWVFNTFLLDTEVEAPVESISAQALRFESVSKQECIDNPRLFRQMFGLLVNAHYQTTPNDLRQLLDDESVLLFALMSDAICVGCVVASLEGGMDEACAIRVVEGKTRPRGHLAPALIASQLGEVLAVRQRCLRIMRIVVHPTLQQHGLGSHMLTRLQQEVDVHYDYLATCFGVNHQLLSFWKKNGFRPLRLGANRDQASGTHSLLMVKSSTDLDWLREQLAWFADNFLFLLADTFALIEPSLVAGLLVDEQSQSRALTQRQLQLVERYADGGSSLESVAAYVHTQLTHSLRSGEFLPHPIILRKVLQRWSWSAIAEEFGLTGRREAERLLRQQVAILLAAP